MDKITQLIDKLNKASDKYYNGLKCSMTDKEWDNLFDKLKELEKESGIILKNSPTQNVGYAVADKLDKIKHSTPLLSLGKTKSIDDLFKFLGDKEGVLSFKLDGGTQIVDYNNTKINYVATRGSSSTNEGQNITHNAKSIIGIPDYILFKDKIQVVGEGIMYKSKLNEINSGLVENEKYANARNLANASSSMLDSKRVAERDIRFVAFNTLEVDGFFETKIEEFEYLKNRGFNVVEHVLVTKNNLKEEINRMTLMRDELDYDIDGLVLAHNDLAYGRSLGKTSHHFKNAMAYKFAEDVEETIIRKIHVDCGKSGQISYVAEFDSVELCGTTVSKSTLNNYEFIKKLQLGIGDTITVMKRNEIIPYVSSNLTRSNTYKKATRCPICGSELVHKGVHQFCINYNCERQVVGRLTHFASRNAMNIDGFSEETINSIRTIKFKDSSSVLDTVNNIYDLINNKESLLSLDRFGEKKVNKIIKSIEESKNMPLNNVLYGLSIPQVGKKASKTLAEYFLSMDNIMKREYLYSQIRQLVGDSVGQSFIDNFLNNSEMMKVVALLKSHGLTMTQEVKESTTVLEGKTFVITGSVNHFENRKELQTKIEELGGKCSGSVSKNTNYLLNNDSESGSSKNKKAKSLNVPIITEEQFLELIK